MANNNTLKEAIYKAADLVYAQMRKAAQCAARGETTTAETILYDCGVAVDHARDLLETTSEE